MLTLRRMSPVLVLIVAGCAPVFGRAPSPGSLRAVVDSVTRTPPLHRTQWGIEVYDATRDVTVLSANADKLFIPASNMKLVTWAAALELLGPDYRFATELIAADATDSVASALFVRGSGDPSLYELFQPTPLAALDSLADSLAAAGITRIAGPLVIDQTRFDSALVHGAWEGGDLDWYYAAPVAPFAVLRGTIPLVITPAALGDTARVDALLPPALVGLDAAILTVEGDDSWSDDVLRIPGTDSLVLRGTIGVEAEPDTSLLAQTDPGRFAGRALRLALADRGITVAGDVVVVNDSAAAAAYAAVEGPRVTWRSPPLADLARPALERSDNWLTEQVLKTLGAELDSTRVGSWSSGTRVLERYLIDVVGADSGALYIRDGSGLTAQNLLTPRLLVALLRHVRAQPWAPAFRSALAAPAELESTLEERLEAFAADVAAKTGSIRNVNSLSGYARTRDGRELVFSILSNASGQPAGRVRRAIDRIVAAILQSGR